MNAAPPIPPLLPPSPWIGRLDQALRNISAEAIDRAARDRLANQTPARSAS